MARTRLEADVANTYRGLIDCVKQTLVKDGPAGLYRSFFISSFTIFLYRATYFGFYDTGKSSQYMQDAGVFKSWLWA